MLDFTNGSGDAKDITSDEEEEREELEAEGHDLKTDKFYHDFLNAVVQHKEYVVNAFYLGFVGVKK